MEHTTFEKDMKDGLEKIIEIGTWLRDCLFVHVGQQWQQKTTDTNVVDITEQEVQPKQKQQIKIGNSISKIKPKGDIELKNITYRFSDKRYVGRKMIKGKRYVVYANTQKECIDKLKELIQRLETGSPIKRKTRPDTLFGEYWDKWYLENKKPFVSQQTADEIERIKRIRLQSIINLPIRKIEKAHILKLIDSIEEWRPREKTILYLKAVFKTAFFEGIIKANPFANIVVRPREFKHKPAFTYEQQVAILNRLEHEEIKPIILIYLLTGLRRREFNFKSIDKDLYEDDFILKAINLKGRNGRKRYKQIQLTKKAFLLIKNNIELIKRYDDETVYRQFAKILNELNIDGSIVNLRHTFATNNFYLGNPDVFIARQMGHSTTQITKDNYTDLDYHLSAEKIRKIYNNLYYIF